MGGDKYEIPSNAINCFIEWNAEPLKHHKAYDKLMVEALLLVFFSTENETENTTKNVAKNMAEETVDDAVREFILGLLKIRTDEDESRTDKLDEYIAEICN